MKYKLSAVLLAATTLATQVSACDEVEGLEKQWSETDELVMTIKDSEIGQTIESLGLGEFYSASVLRCPNSPKKLGFNPNPELIDMGEKQSNACDKLSELESETDNGRTAIEVAHLGMLCQFF